MSLDHKVHVINTFPVTDLLSPKIRLTGIWKGNTPSKLPNSADFTAS